MKAVQKLKEREQGVEPAPAPKKQGQRMRTVVEIVTQAVELGVDQVIGTLTEEELILMIDTGTELEAERREIEKKTEAVVRPVKQILLQVAKAAGWKEKKGTKGKAKVSASTWSDVGTATDLAKILKREGKIALFDELVTVRVGDCKKYLGTEALKGFLTPHTEEFGMLSLKEL